MNNGATFVRNWQRTLRLGQDAAARKLGISQAAFSRIVRGTVPSVATVRQIAPALNVTPLRLLVEFGVIEREDDPTINLAERAWGLTGGNYTKALAVFSALLDVIFEEQEREGTEQLVE